MTLELFDTAERTPIVLMDATEAREKTERIKHGLADVRQLLLEMYEREGWKALEYASWREYGQAEFGYSESRVYELLGAAKAQREISAMAEMPLPERQLRPLTRLEPDQQREAWREAVETAPEGKVTGAHVERVVERMTRPVTHGPRGDQDERVAYVQDERQKHVHVSANSGNNEWYTPPQYIEAARAVMGGIDCDPASSDKANEAVRATTYYTAETDGLVYEWPGRVWMNPPYAKGLVEEFATALVEQLGDPITQACVLVNNAAETGWFQMMLKAVDAVCFIKGRVKYLNSSGEPENSPLQGQAILYFGENVARFAEKFGEFGRVLYAIR